MIKYDRQGYSHTAVVWANTVSSSRKYYAQREDRSAGKELLQLIQAAIIWHHQSAADKQQKEETKNRRPNGTRFVDGVDKCCFLFLERDDVSPTNNLSEQAIRFVIIDRRVTQGTRSWSGMRFCERAWTVVATCARHKRSVYEFFVDALNATYKNTTYPKLIPAKLWMVTSRNYLQPCRQLQIAWPWSLWVF